MKKIVSFLLLFCALQSTVIAMDNNNNNLRNRKNNSEKVDENQEEQDICAICRFEFESKESEKKEQCITLSCKGVNKHTFHADCIKSWAKQHSICPICRINLTDEELKKLKISRAAQPPTNIDVANELQNFLRQHNLRIQPVQEPSFAPITSVVAFGIGVVYGLGYQMDGITNLRSAVILLPYFFWFGNTRWLRTTYQHCGAAGLMVIGFIVGRYLASYRFG